MARVDFRATEGQALGAETDRVLRAILVVMLAELNALRVIVVPPLPALTRAQLVERLKAALR